MKLAELIDLASPDLREITFHTDGRVIAKTGARAKFPKKLYGSRTAKNTSGLPNSVKTKEVLLKLIIANMNPEIENIIRGIMANNIKIKMLEKEQEGLIINKEKVLEILTELTEPKELTSNCCGAKTTEPDSSGLATCRECHEGCVAEDPEEEKFLAEQAKLIAEQEAINHSADPNNIN